jgi:N-hydroxyarylamine O-acetyltransferase
MVDDAFDLDAWLRRIGLERPLPPTLGTLRAVVEAHATTIPFENIDVLLGRVPLLDLASLQRKIVTGGRGGYCFELNTLLRAGLTGLGFQVTGLIARVIRGLDINAERPAMHMVLRVDLPEGAFVADVGFGAQTPTAPLAWRPEEVQATPHEPTRLWPVADELVVQAQHGEDWQNIYRISPRPPLPADYEVANWFCATHPASPFTSNFIAVRPRFGGVRATLCNGRMTIRRPGAAPERVILRNADYPAVLRDTFGLDLAPDELEPALAALDGKGTRGVEHPFFT